MPVDVITLKDEIVTELAIIIADKEKLSRFSLDVEDTVLTFSNRPSFSNMFDQAVDDPHIQHVIASMIASYMYKEFLKGKLNITLAVT